MTCPRCSVGEISSRTNTCEVCGYAPAGTVAVQTPPPRTTWDIARSELANQFRISVLLGQGATAAAYLAREQESDRQVVLKALLRHPTRRSDADEEFRRAIAAVAALDHPHIVRTYRHGMTDSLFWYSMEYVRGRSLRDVLLADGRLDLRTCLRIVAQVASALDYIHRRGLIHGDLKPENVLLDTDGWVRVSDVLIARACEPAPARESGSSPPELTGAVAAPSAPRPPYVAPEDFTAGQRGPAADQYALGVLVHEFLVGTVPQEGIGTPHAELAAVRPEVPPHVIHAVGRALSPKPSDRFQGVLDFATALESGEVSLADVRPSGASGSTMVLMDPDWRPHQRPLLAPRILKIAGLVAVAAVLIVMRPRLAGMLRQTPDRRSLPPAAAPAPAPSVDSIAPAAPTAPSAVRLPESPSRRQRTREARASQPAAPARPTPRETGRAPEPPPGAAVEPQAGGGAEAGRLFVNATPWGQLYVDGHLVGNTPKANLTISAGAHTIRVARDGFEPFERTIQVVPGGVVRLTDIVLVERRP
jgi:serine/threonine-protein kinase